MIITDSESEFGDDSQLEDRAESEQDDWDSDGELEYIGPPTEYPFPSIVEDEVDREIEHCTAPSLHSNTLPGLPSDPALLRIPSDVPILSGTITDPLLAAADMTSTVVPAPSGLAINSDDPLDSETSHSSTTHHESPMVTVAVTDTTSPAIASTLPVQAVTQTGRPQRNKRKDRGEDDLKFCIGCGKVVSLAEKKDPLYGIECTKTGCETGWVSIHFSFYVLNLHG